MGFVIPARSTEMVLMKTSKALQAAVGAILAIGVQQAAIANVYTYSFDQLTSCESGLACSQLPGGQLGPSPWGSITFADMATPNTVKMTFTLGTGFGVGPETGATPWDSFLYLNYDKNLGAGGANLGSLAITWASGEKAIEIKRSNNAYSENGQGAYDIAFTWKTEHNLFSEGEFSSYTITNAQAIMFTSTTNHGYVAGMAMMQSADSPNLIAKISTTSPIATPIPEPETYAMLLAGLGLLGFMAGRRKQQVA
jgi:hypothetical protein